MNPGIWRLAADPCPRPTLFLDRDGVIIEDAHYLSSPDDVRLIPGSAEALAVAAAADWRLVCLTNQSGIGRGYYTEAQFHAVQTRVDELLAARGVVLDGVLYCPHDPDAACGCRKPALGMIEAAASKIIWSSGSVMIGDKVADLDLGRGAGLTPMLVRTGKGADVEQAGLQRGAVVYDDLAAAIVHVLGGGRP